MRIAVEQELERGLLFVVDARLAALGLGDVVAGVVWGVCVSLRDRGRSRRRRARLTVCGRRERGELERVVGLEGDGGLLVGLLEAAALGGEPLRDVVDVPAAK